VIILEKSFTTSLEWEAKINFLDLVILWLCMDVVKASIWDKG